ncbi:Tad domain-containing protein (plasmid) [Photobacterium sp. DA100]|uniref:Tad domain-containing protein n=1 Tax=Photobacterium sp. DA100 TaxID=3027472 RepID=UPI0024797839|nr:Tad domain-containing protein [Photobacterium sp. DA100]WEM45623.1 Tad domain-containing protein [Photobacterium sp. DA100]
MRAKTRYSRPSKQKGVVVVFATLAMAVLIGAGALALDVGNLVLSKGKLQNLADSAALSAAKTIDLGGTQADAITAGTQAINDNLSYDGYTAIELDNATIAFEFSENLPFDPSTATTDSPYVRVRIENVDIPDFLVSIMKIDLSTRASAVAGPSSSLGRSCNIVPLSICAGDDSSENNIAGYSTETLHVLKASSTNPSDLGPGNFMPITLTDADGNPQTGADAYREALAGKYDSCLTLKEGEQITTETGNMVGPTLALDSRFEGFKVPGLKDEDYIPDINSEYDKDNIAAVMLNPETNKYEPNKTAGDLYSYSDYMGKYESQNYESCLNSSSCQEKGYFRRIVTVPILDCSTASKNGGRMEVELKGLGCFFISQPVSETTTIDDNSGNGDGSWIIGEFIKDCRNNSGNASNEPNEEGPYKIVLFADPDSGDS